MSFFQNITDKFYWSLPYWAKNLYYQTRDSFFPRQKWLTKKIPNSWADKTWLIAMIASESIIHFIEEEKAFEHIEWSSTPEHKEAGEAFSRAYKYAKLRIPILEEKNEYLWKDKDLTEFFDTGFMVPLPNQEDNKHKRYTLADPPEKAKKILAQIRENDKEIEWMMQEVVEIVAKYRNFMWT